MKELRKIYLDGAANTPLDKRVLKAMLPYMSENFVGNAFASHIHGIEARCGVENARIQIAKTFNVKTSEVYFTSGATESNNWVISTLTFLNKGKHIVCSAIEHNSVLNVCKTLERNGLCRVTYVLPDSTGRILAKDIKKAIEPDTFLCCVMSVNNETGKFNEISEIGKLCKKNKILFLSDFTQYLTSGKTLNFSQDYAQVDYFTFSGHKIYGPTGTGCLIARKDVPLKPFMLGGSQEFGLRPGTSNTAGIVGLGEACKILSEEYENNSSHYCKLYLFLLRELVNNDFDLSGLSTYKTDHVGIVSLDLSKYFNSDNLANDLSLQNISVSSGSACDTEHSEGDYNPSHVLVALGKNERSIRNTIRISFTKYTTKKDITDFVKRLKELQNERI